jgi:serine protease
MRDATRELPWPPEMRTPSPRSIRLTALATAAVLGLPGAATAATRPGEVVVRYASSVDRAARSATQHAAGVVRPRAFAPRTRVLRTRAGRSVGDAIRALRARRGVLSATPVQIAHASGFIPDDPGTAGVRGGWAQLQWNLLAEHGVDAPTAWDHLIRAGRPGGAGVTVAVLDTGVAYADRGRFRRSPDLSPARLRAGYDFVASDAFPNDQNGHGTHVASTVAESADNGIGVTGIAYGARIMPVRVLDSSGAGDAIDIARGIRFAARRGAQVINLSFEFESSTTGSGIPEVIDALRYAQRRGALVVGAAGNAAGDAVAYPARSSLVMSVGAVTEHGCQADYSNRGTGLDISAPGGGPDADIAGDPNCRPDDPPGRDIYQLTFDGSVKHFGLPSGYVGTSMATPHVSASAALVIASGVLGPHPTPRAVTARLEATARPLGRPGSDVRRYGAGLVDAARATDPATKG